VLSLTRKADYAVMAMAELARRQPDRASARDLSETLSLPLPILTAVLHQLRQAGLIDSTLGGKGGYSLARVPQLISLAEIIEAIEGPIRLALCCADEHDEDAEGHKCDLESNCRIKEPVRRVHGSLRRFLEQIRLSQLAFGSVPVAVGVTKVSESECIDGRFAEHADPSAAMRPGTAP
jgi:Rrf2 family protein